MVEAKKQGVLIDIDTLEDSEGSKGAVFDPEVQYTFEVTEVQTRKLTTKDDKGHEREFNVIDVFCTEQEQEMTIKQSFFHNKKVTINEQDKTRETDAVKFARGIGYPVGVGLPFKWKEVFRPGIKFTAHTRKQKNKDGTESAYSEIDLLTMKMIKGAKASAAKQSGVAVSDEDKSYLKTLAMGYPNKDAVVRALGKLNRPDLINVLIQLDAANELSYLQ